MFDADFQRHVAPHLRGAMMRLRDPNAVWDIFRDDATIARMHELSERRRPAVGATSERLLELGEWVRERDSKTTFGKLARCVMEASGYIVDMSGVETPEDPLFTKGTRYHRRAPTSVNPAGEVLVLNGIDRETASRLRARAARNGRSIDAEALSILTEALAATRGSVEANLAEAIHRRFAAIGGIEDLPVHPPVPTGPPEFDS